MLLATLGIGAVLPSPQYGRTAAGASALSLAPSVQPAVPAAAVPVVADGSTPLPRSVPVALSIPDLGVTSDVVELGLEDDGSMEVPPGAYPAGWYDGSPTPGEIGPSILVAHVDWAGDPGVFHRIRELAAGDEVVVTRQDASVATFAVERVEDHPKDHFPTAAVYGDVGHPALRLITCGGAFDEDSGDYEDNVVVFATFVGGGS